RGVRAHGRTRTRPWPRRTRPGYLKLCAPPSSSLSLSPLRYSGLKLP
ncbi:hypothetical protein AVDCRST_MAG94-4822, partial [uncultured Leptolyngbya sp.]